MSLVNPGDQVFYVDRVYRIIIPCLVQECNDVHSSKNPKLSVLGPIFHHRFLDESKDYARIPTDKTDELGWTIYENEVASFLQDSIPCNQLLFLDEPIGHSVRIGDECFLTLSEALNYCPTSKKKHLKRRLKWFRRDGGQFVKDKLPGKTVYVRKG